jgi:hypothetical protein
MEKHERKHIHKEKEDTKLKTFHTIISGKSNYGLLTNIPLKLKITQVLKEMYLLRFFPIPLVNQNYKYIYKILYPKLRISISTTSQICIWLQNYSNTFRMAY